MNILLVHNFYGSSAPSGENQVFELERTMLERHGHDVRTFIRRSDEVRSAGVLGLLKGAAVTPWNPFTPGRVRRALTDSPRDVVHVHNTFPLISPAVFHEVRGRAARVLTLHNYRLFCSAAFPLRDGRTCTECLDARSVLPALRHRGCYRGSRLATLPLALGVALHRALGTWEHHVEAFIVFSEFQRDLMVRAGLPANRVWVKPNFYPGNPMVTPWSDRADCVVFAGRISEEKGLAYLLEAWLAWGADAPELRILGHGPLRSALESRVRARGCGRVTFLGQVGPAVAEAEIARARLLVLPSIGFEGFPMVLREAFAFGTPAAVSNVGPLPSIVDHGRTGVLFAPGDPRALLETVRSVWGSPGLRRMGTAARSEFEKRYSEEANHRQLMAIYDHAIEAQRQRGHP